MPFIDESSTSLITVRAAKPDDAHDGARLIFCAGPEIYTRLLGGNRNLALGVLEKIFAAKGALISYDNAIMAEINGRITGITVIYDKATEKRQGIRFLKEVFKALPLFNFIKAFIFMLAMAVFVPKIGPDSVYGCAIAVDGNARGKGVGVALLNETMNHVIRMGHTRFEADVETDNENAIRIYKKFGFDFRSIHFTGMLKFILHFKGYHRIAVDVEGKNKSFHSN